MVDGMDICLQLQAWMVTIECFRLLMDFFESESKESWTWFLLQLRKAIGEPTLLAIHSDACKGLTEAVKDVFPNAERRECFRHLMQNYVKLLPGHIGQRCMSIISSILSALMV
jgi:transposase-like protein